jgi:hypothetical protein
MAVNAMENGATCMKLSKAMRDKEENNVGKVDENTELNQ